jgi:hypothetical protein
VLSGLLDADIGTTYGIRAEMLARTGSGVVNSGQPLSSSATASSTGKAVMGIRIADVHQVT